jgi:hypothetical protein
VIGRIQHRGRPRLFHGRAAHAHAQAQAQTSLTGCDGSAKIATSLLRAAPAGPVLAAISGAGGAAIGGFGGYVAGRETKEHKHRHDHDGDGRTPVPEPASVLLFVSAVLICAVGRRFAHRPAMPHRSQR